MNDKKTKRIQKKAYVAGIMTGLLLVVLLYLVSMILPIGGTAKRPGTIQSLRKASEIQRLVRKHYLGEVDEQLQTDYMYLGQVTALGDMYSTYYTKDQYEQIRQKQDGVFEGIGIVIAQRTEDERLEVISVIDDSPAEKAGIEEGDILISINKTDVTAMSTSEATELIRGIDEKDEITIVLEREGETGDVVVTLKKEVMESVSVESEMLEDGVGYIKITSFTKLTPAQYKMCYSKLHKQGMKKLVIDLRDNMGGLVDPCCDTLRQILPKGVIVYSEDNQGKRSEKKCDGKTRLKEPLVVLVNQNTASSAEIFAGAIKDYEVGALLGTKTYGKGIIQNSYKLSDGSVLKLTTSHYYTPKGNDIHEIGIAPDVQVEQPEQKTEDMQLIEALLYLEKIQ